MVYYELLKMICSECCTQIFDRLYRAEYQRRESARISFRAQHRRQHGRRAPTPRIRELPRFSSWLEAEISAAYAADPQSVSPLLLASSKLPDVNATSYKSMKAYGMHLCCKGAEVHMSTADNGVATSFDRLHKSSMDGPNPEVRREEYLGWIKEILELNYREHCVVVLACN
jgi:hypothetical protein